MAKKHKAPQLGALTDGDTFVGTSAVDTFYLGVGTGRDVVVDFHKTTTPDRIYIDSGTNTNDGYLGDHWGVLSDGRQIINSNGLLVATVHETDINGDGIIDTQFLTPNGDSLTLLSTMAVEVTGFSIFGG